MAFMFQIFFPAWHALASRTLVVFFSIGDCSEDLIVPPNSCGELHGIEVSQEQIAGQQLLHAAFLCDRRELKPCATLLSPAEHRQLKVNDGASSGSAFGYVGPHPEWLLGDETPGDLEGGHTSQFCLMTVEHLRLPRRHGAPEQLVIDYFAPGNKRLERSQWYQLFAGNAAYYFAYPQGECRVLVTVQGN